MTEFKRTIIQTDDMLANVCSKLLVEERFASVDSETLGLDCRKHPLRLIQIAGRDLQETFIIDYFKIKNPAPLREFMLSGIPKLNFNGQFDTCFFMHNFDAYIEHPIDLFLAALLLKRYGLPPGIKPDTPEARRAKLVAYIKDKLIEKGKGLLKLNSLLKLYTGIEISKELQVSDWSGDLTNAQLDYASKDVELLFPLFDSMIDDIIREGLEDTFVVENGCQLATAMMHYYGIKINLDELEIIGNEIAGKIKSTEEQIGKYPEFQSEQQSMIDMMMGKITTIDIGSHVQTGKALEKRWGARWWEQFGMKKASIQGADLKKMHDRDPELVTLLSERSSLQSMYSNHVEGILGDTTKKSGCINPVTGRVHSDFLQNASPQQRYSSENPILLNIPAKISFGPGVSNIDSLMHSNHNFRDCFVPEPGCVFIKTDYRALQLMALAQESNDPTLIKIFNEGLDAHTITASVIYNVPESEIEKGSSRRYTAKTVGYAVGFVCGPERLQSTFSKDDVHFPLDECKLFIDRYMRKYTGVADYHKSQRVKARREQKVRVHGGRSTLFQGDVGERPTDSVNFPMALYEQSGGKNAAMRIARIVWKLKELGIIARIVLMIHDEILLEVEERYATSMAEVLEREMVQCMSEYIYKVPIEAETTICRTWGGKEIATVGMPLPFKIKGRGKSAH